MALARAALRPSRVLGHARTVATARAHRVAAPAGAALTRSLHNRAPVDSLPSTNAIGSARHLRTSAVALGSQPFKLADIGEGITEVQLTEWFVKEGDSVKEGDMVCAVESDKASVELASTLTGKITKLNFKVQDSVKVGASIMDVEVAGAAAAPAPAPAAAKPAPAPAAAPAAAGGAVQQFKLADIGEGIAEVQLTEWFVKVGDKVNEMDNICAVESDKASVELTSPYTGTVMKLHHATSDTVKVGAVLCDISGGSAPAASAPAPAPAAAAPAPAPAAAGGSAVQQFKLADIGEGIAEVQLTEMFVKVGDMVKEMDNICSVESDKASVELTSPYTGKVVKVHHKVSDTVKVGGVLVEIEVEGAAPASAPAPAAAARAPAPAAAPAAAAVAAAPAATGAAAKAPGVLATPKVRGLAKEKGVDLTKVVGTGAAGRVLAENVLAAAAAAVAAAAPAPAAAAVAAKGAPAVAAPPRPTIRPGEDLKVEITDMVGKGMIKSMQESLSVPYMALGEEIDVTEMIAMQKALKEFALKKYGTKVTLTSFILKAISLACDEFPIVNSKFGPIDAKPNHYTMYGNHNIAVAIDSPFGLMVPNIKDVGNLSVIEVQNELMRLAMAAKANKLALPDIKGGTITFSNVGVIGTKDPRPILFDGQAVIGAAGRTMTLPRYNAKGELVPRQIMNVRWVGDHRHLDGATLARFSNSFKRYVEDPREWLLNLR